MIALSEENFMGYLFLTLSLLSGATKGYCGKSISNKVQSLKGTFYINFIRMALCILVGFLVVAFESLSGFSVDITTLLITMLSGVATAMFVVFWIISVRQGAYVMLDVFLMLGVGVTIALCKLFFNEPIRLNQYIGFSLLVLASIIMCSYSSSLKNKLTVKSFITLILCGISNGLTDFSQKLFINFSPDGSVGVFNFYTYVFASITLLIFFLMYNKLEIAENDGKSKQVFIYILIMAICLFANSFFKTLAARYIDSATLYPLSTGASLILSVFMASLLFKEKATPKCIIGVTVAFISLIILNL